MFEQTIYQLISNEFDAKTRNIKLGGRKNNKLHD